MQEGGKNEGSGLNEELLRKNFHLIGSRHTSIHSMGGRFQLLRVILFIFMLVFVSLMLIPLDTNLMRPWSFSS